MKAALHHTSSQLAAIDQKRLKLTNRLVKATSNDIANAYEVEIGNLTKQERIWRNGQRPLLNPKNDLMNASKLQ